MWIARDNDALNEQRGQLTGRVGFVPTMGALHDGHLSLVRAARERTDHVIVSIFVNPTQFGPDEDFDAYPRPQEADLDLCREHGVAGVYAPTADVVYPPDQPATELVVPDLAARLEGKSRPGHFDGVCRVVAKLLNLVRPDTAFFGEKDYQQLRIIEAMVADLFMPVTIVGCPIVREPDGLARSSRNAYLTPPQRERAVGLFKALVAAHRACRDGESDPDALARHMNDVLQAHEIAVDYAVIRRADNLAPPDSLDPPCRALIAGRVGDVRLIDNHDPTVPLATPESAS
ncbi:MAG: pantoate--beta-alanine ligase [Phycisphaeraceae bacterium]|nr:pantoate--beta-alanine ligase [Phycisphaeraceae bacterium]